MQLSNFFAVNRLMNWLIGKTLLNQETRLHHRQEFKLFWSLYCCVVPKSNWSHQRKSIHCQRNLWRLSISTWVHKNDMCTIDWCPIRKQYLPSTLIKLKTKIMTSVSIKIAWKTRTKPSLANSSAIVKFKVMRFWSFCCDYVRLAVIQHW